MIKKAPGDATVDLEPHPNIQVQANRFPLASYYTRHAQQLSLLLSIVQTCILFNFFSLSNNFLKYVYFFSTLSQLQSLIALKIKHE